MKIWNKIQFKWTFFISILLITTMSFLGFFLLEGIKDQQVNTYESMLLENSKISNWYIREQFIIHRNSSENKYKGVSNENFNDFYVNQAYNLSKGIEQMVHLPIALFDINGNLLDGQFTDNLEEDEYILLKRSLKNEIVYKKKSNTIVYFAPIYDTTSQIGAMKIIYSADSEAIFYHKIKRLFLRISIISIILSNFIAISYFARVAGKINLLKKNIKSIETENYDIINPIVSNDELDELSRGIVYAGNKIQSNLKSINEKNAQLTIALDKLEAIGHQQKSFIGNITHEFKTPLTVIKNQMDLMCLYKDDKELVSSAKLLADKEIKRLDDMVAKTLHLSKLERYEFDQIIEMNNMKNLITDISQRMEAKANKYGIEILYNLEEISLECDNDNMILILINLIDNAIKYNNINGKIYIRLYRKSNCTYIEVEDTGIGISDEDKQRVFEPFYVVDKNRSRKFSGTGLGLSLVKKLVESQGLEIKALDGKSGVLMQIKSR